jgi:citrate synthase
MSKVLFEVTEEHLETGIRGYPVGYCTTSTVDPEKGLFYGGLPVSDMATWDPLSVIFLLHHGHKPTGAELVPFKKEIEKRAHISDEFEAVLRAMPRKAHPMQLLTAALALAAGFEGSGDYREDSLRVVAKIPLIVATLINHHAGWVPQKSDPALGYMENFTHLLNVPNSDSDNLNEVFRIFNILHYDHGGGNLCAFVAKSVASGLQDMWGSLSASMSALSGPRHGKANQDCLNFVKEVMSQLGDNPTGDQVEALLRKRLDNGELVYGFGHAVLRVEDPRATLFYEIGAKKYPHDPLVKVATLLRDAGSHVLEENPKVADPHPNVDAISGTILSAAGFAYPEYFTVLFGLSRVVGVSRQIVYERLEAREGKGVPITRPKFFFKAMPQVG